MRSALKLKTYAWETESGIRKVVAAPSKKAAITALHTRFPPRWKEVVETTEDIAISTTTAAPGTIFYRPTQRSEGTRYAPLGMPWIPRPTRPTWKGVGPGISVAEASEEGLSFRMEEWTSTTRGGGHAIAVLVGGERHTPRDRYEDIDTARRAAESLARKLVAEEIAKLQRVLMWLGPEPKDNDHG